jgi:hypothetical protein
VEAQVERLTAPSPKRSTALSHVDEGFHASVVTHVKTYPAILSLLPKEQGSLVKELR